MRWGQDVRLYASLLSGGTAVDLDLEKDRHAWVQVVSGRLDINGLTCGSGDGVAVSEESRSDHPRFRRQRISFVRSALKTKSPLIGNPVPVPYHVLRRHSFSTGTMDGNPAMCGRIILTSAPHVLAEKFFLDMVPEVIPRYNIAPASDIAAVVANPRSVGRLVKMFRWGLVPPWSKGPEVGAKMINARSETVMEKPSFKEAFAARRCLIPVDGFYEWQKRDGRQAALRLPAQGPFGLRPGGPVGKLAGS